VPRHLYPLPEAFAKPLPGEAAEVWLIWLVAYPFGISARLNFGALQSKQQIVELPHLQAFPELRSTDRNRGEHPIKQKKIARNDEDRYLTLIDGFKSVNPENTI